VPIDNPGSVPGDPVFAACHRLFRDYPLAVRRHYAEFRYGSMVLVARSSGAISAGTATFTVLIMERDDLFVIRPWDRRDWARVEIRPGGAVPAGIRRLLNSSVPVPRDGALLGWVSGGQVRAVLTPHGRLPEPWEDPFTVPRITVLALAGSDPARWPPSPLAERQLWEHSARGQLADVSALVARRTGHAFWIPAAAHSARQLHAPGGHVVVTERLGTADCWLPAGVYAGQQALLDGLPVPPARQLLALPGVTDLASGTPQPAATVQAACSPYETSPG